MTRLSSTQRAGLLSLHRGWRFGIDGRTARGLQIRGLIDIETDIPLSSGLALDLPYLTEAGRAVAAELYQATLAAAGAERRGRFTVVPGGRTPR